MKHQRKFPPLSAAAKKTERKQLNLFFKFRCWIKILNLHVSRYEEEATGHLAQGGQGIFSKVEGGQIN